MSDIKKRLTRALTTGTYRDYEDVRNTVVRELRSIEQNLLAGIASDEDEGNLMWLQVRFVDMLKMVYEQIDVSIGDVLYARGLRPTPGNEDVSQSSRPLASGKTCLRACRCSRTAGGLHLRTTRT